MSTRKPNVLDQPDLPRQNGAEDVFGSALVGDSSPAMYLKSLARLLARQGARDWMADASTRIHTGSIAETRATAPKIKGTARDE